MVDRKKAWLKVCKCGKYYWGNAKENGCVECRVQKVLLKRVCDCGCGKEFEYESKSNLGYERRYFNKACQMRARRRTVVGKAYVEKYNQRYKRAEREWKCKFPLCNKVFISAYKRSYCDEHSNPSSQNVVWRKKNPLKAKAHESINSFYRDRYNKGRKRGSCLVCDKKKTEAHHHDYSKPKDVTFLCKKHHHEIHSWDAK